MAGHPTGTGSLSENWLKEGDSFMAKVLTSWNEIAADLGKGVRTVKMSKGSVSWEANRFLHAVRTPGQFSGKTAKGLCPFCWPITIARE